MKKSYKYVALSVFLIIAAISIWRYNYGKQGQSEILTEVLNDSGENRNELEKVIRYFKQKKDKRQLHAAMYLISNLGFQYHYSGDVITGYRKSFYSVDSLFKSNHGRFNKSWDSIQKLTPPPALKLAEFNKDIETIKGELIIRHVNAAFKAWGYPWAKALTFKEFCEYILPYKLVNEEPELWMEQIQKEYAWLLDSMGKSKDPKKACIMLNKVLRRRYNLNGRFKCNWDVNYSDLKKLRQGQCSHLTQLTAYVMRAMGMPVTMDFTPHWANKNGGHGWNGLLYKGKVVMFMGCESDPGKTKLEFTRSEWMIRKVAKVYRKMYAQQNEFFLKEFEKTGEVDEFFLDQRIIDVTREYFPVADVNLTLEATKGHKLAYLCVFNENKWQAIAVSQIGFFSKVNFQNIGRDIMYLPMYSLRGVLKPAGLPFVITKEGNKECYSPENNNLLTCRLDRKYPEDKTNLIEPGLPYELFYWDSKWTSIEKKTARGPVLQFKKVPANAVLLLRCLNKGKQERIFSYEQQKQVWW